MAGLSIRKKDTIKWIIAIHLILLFNNLYSQSGGPGIIGNSFIAMNVSDADSAAKWYEEMFGLKLLKEIKTSDGSAHIRIEGNSSFMVEIIQVKDSKTLTDCQLQKDQSHLLRGFFKTGVFVSDIQKAEDYFKSKGVAIRHSIFSDKETATMSFILEDPNGNMIQFIQDNNRHQAR
jgi:catechol-2,3-dioxygenase